MFRLCTLFCIGTMFAFVSCSEKESDAPPIPPAGPCSDLLASTVSYGIFHETINIWAQTFNRQYQVADTAAYSFSLPADSLTTYLSGTGNCESNCYDGIKAYLGLDNPITTTTQMQDELCLILVPYVDNMDAEFPGHFGPYILVQKDTISYIDSTTAQNRIDNWQDHYMLEDSIVVRLRAFVIPDSTLWKTIGLASASQSLENDVYLIFGSHTISPQDTAYCVETTPAYHSCTSCYGYEVLALILSNKNANGDLEHSEDFLRPCPRYCGDSKFHFKP